MDLKKIVPLVLCFLNSIYGFSQQKELEINGIVANTNDCAAIKIYKVIPEVLPGYLCEIKDAQVTGDCLELTIIYGSCNGNLELITDSIIDKNSKLNFKARWIEPSFCKTFTLKKVSFDLKPFKEMVIANMASIKILNTTFDIYYSY